VLHKNKARFWRAVKKSVMGLGKTSKKIFVFAALKAKWVSIRHNAATRRIDKPLRRGSQERFSAELFLA
jgi:hypothetical protein